MGNKNSFVLTQDLIPILLTRETSEMRSGCAFACPLPKGYKEVIERADFKEFSEMCEKIKNEIHIRVAKCAHPFQNIFFGYEDRTKEQRELLLKNFKIERIHIDNRGVYSVWAGGDVNSGDVYMSTNLDFNNFWFCRFFEPFSEFLEPQTGFACHNMDYYWQALLTREFCIEYFNWLNRERARMEI